MISLILGFYILIPTILFMVQSLTGIKTIDFIKKHKNIFIIFYTIFPLIISMVMTLTGNNPEEEKIVEAYMSEAVTGDCEESNNKYKYAVGIVTLVMAIFSFGPFLTLHKLQPITAFLYLVIASLLIRIIYMFQDNYESYNILNPMRHSKNSEEVDLDSTISIEVTIVTIFISVCLLVTFRKMTQ